MIVRDCRLIWAGIVVACLAAGCLNPRYTRLPRLISGDPRAERADLERHDPFPSRTLGTETFTRPQGHIDQRSDVRRIREEAALRGMNRNPPVTQPFPQSSRKPYPDTVPD